MLLHAQRLSGNVSQTCRFFGVSRALYYIWKARYEKPHIALGLPRLPVAPGALSTPVKNGAILAGFGRALLLRVGNGRPNTTDVLRILILLTERQ